MSHYWLVLSTACSVVPFVNGPLTTLRADWFLQLIEKLVCVILFLSNVTN